jgi:hypothetical protein
MLINDVKNVFRIYSLFADDLKIYTSMVVNSVDDCKKLQNDFVRYSNWCVANHLKINVDKCAQIFFTRRNNLLMYNYCIDDKALRVVKSIKDLGIILSADPSPSQSISSIYGKAMHLLGFIRRQCSDFNDIRCLSTLYYSLIHSNLNYRSLI